MARFLCLVGVLALIGVAQAAHDHVNGGKHVNLAKPGMHQIPHATHTVHAHVNKDKKVHAVTAKNKQGKEVKLHKKYKTAKKQHALANSPGKVQVVMAGSPETVHALVAEANAPTLYVGFAFFFGNQLVIFWFPVNDVQGGDTGCDNYDQMN